jgi:hypothetical protein
MSQSQLLTAILEADLDGVSKLLSADPKLAQSHLPKANLYQTSILHWLYVNDTPLHLAAAGYRVNIAKALIKAGANPNSSANHRKGTPLHYASDGVAGSPEWNPGLQVKMIELLVKAGAEINAQDKNGATPLHRAVRTRCAKAVEILLKRGADPTLKNKPGSTPFHLAVQNTGRGGSGSDAAKAEQQKIIQEFLSLGMDKKAKDGNGKTVLEAAQSEWIKELLT